MTRRELIHTIWHRVLVPHLSCLGRLNTPGEARGHGVRVYRVFPFKILLTVDNSFLFVHPGKRPLRTVPGDCLSAEVEQIRPNVLRGMGWRWFVAKRRISPWTAG